MTPGAAGPSSRSAIGSTARRTPPGPERRPLDALFLRRPRLIRNPLAMSVAKGAKGVKPAPKPDSGAGELDIESLTYEEAVGVTVQILERTGWAAGLAGAADAAEVGTPEEKRARGGAPEPARDFYGAAPTDPYCDVCGMALEREIAGAEITFVCPCGEVKAGTAADRLARRADVRATVAGGVPAPGSLALFATLVRNAPFDPTAEFADRACACGATRMARTVVSDAMIVFYSCRCGAVQQSR